MYVCERVSFLFFVALTRRWVVVITSTADDSFCELEKG